MTPITEAKKMFESYAGMDEPDLPFPLLSQLQVKLCRWQNKNFGGGSPLEFGAGIAEEVGELTEGLMALMVMAGRVSHATLKATQKIRGFNEPEKLREAVGDAIADIAIFSINLCTLLRLDYGFLVQKTAEEVMKRDWKNPSAPKNGVI